MPDDIAEFLATTRMNTAAAISVLHMLINRYPRFANELNELWIMLDDEQRKVTSLLES